MFCDKRGQVFYFLVRFYLSILNQSTSTQPPSLVLMAGRVQNVPTLAPIHLPSFTWNSFPNLWNFFPLVL